jgi:hypothetical protein
VSCGRNVGLAWEHAFEVIIMMPVRHVADTYGVSTAFLVRALAQVGFPGAQVETPVPSVVLARFEAKFGPGIREAKAKQAPDLRPDPFSRPRREPEPHVMRVAHARVGAGRDEQGNRAKKLLDSPGLVHAIDAAGTWDGDPWRGRVVPGDVHFFSGGMDSGPPAACGLSHMRAVLGDEFVPADDPESEGQCKRCAALVADGKGFRDGPGYMGSPYCERSVRVTVDGDTRVKMCSLRFRHGGPHRAPDGCEWEVGMDDYVPAPSELGRRITKAS